MRHSWGCWFRKLPSLNFGTVWLVGWLALAAWFGIGREWLQHAPAPVMASASQPKPIAPVKEKLVKAPKLEAVAISSMRVGDQVPTDNPTGEKDDEFGDTVDPPRWRKLVLLAPKKDGSFADVELLRPLAWVEEQHAAVGGSVEIHVPECGIGGRAEVLAIEPCPAIQHDHRFRIVTGTFKHQASKVLDVYVEGLDEPIGTTPNHPFWSEDRQKFVRADELKEGEHLRAFNGTPIVRRVVPLSGPEPVFNLEVQCDHVYHVARSGVLVHNSDPCDHIVLGIAGYAKKFAPNIGGRHLMEDPRFMQTVVNAAKNPNVKISVVLDGLTGKNVKGKVENAIRQVEQLGPIRSGFTNTELSILKQNGRLGDIDFYIDGVLRSNPFQ